MTKYTLWPRGIGPLRAMTQFLAIGASSAMATAADAPAHFSLTVELRPSAPINGALQGIDVTVSVQGEAVPAGGRIAVLPVVTSALTTSAPDISGFAITDAQGTVAVHIQDVTRNSDNIDRYWIADRATVGTLTWRYHVAVDPTKPLLSLPMYELRSTYGTLSGAGNSFLALPTDSLKRRVSVRWDLRDLPPGAVGLSSFGNGDSTSGTDLTTEELSSTYYMVGAPKLFRATAGGFFAGWQGRPAFDMAILMRWAGKLHGYYGTFFRDPKPVFGIFGRSNPINPGSGVGLTNSFAFTFGDTTTAADLKSMLAHEMLHVWVSSLDTVGDEDTLSGSWFGEGLAVYYQRNLPYRAKAISADEYLADLNRTAIRYYTDSMIATPNDRIAGAFWKDTRVRVLPYDRGSLYFAKLNAEIVRASGGRRSLDDLVLSLLAERHAGRPMTIHTWKTYLRRELGDAGIADWQTMLTGRRIELASDSFGPCFVRTTVPLGEFDMGYDFVASNAKGRIVQGLKPGSNAALAGLRDGDVVMKGGARDATQWDPNAMVTLQVERAGRPLTIQYSARGRILQIPQWIKDKGRKGECET